MKRLLPTTVVMLTLVSTAAMAADRECFDTYSPYCREKFTADNLPALHKPDPNIPRDAALIKDVNKHLLDAKELEKRVAKLKMELDEIEKRPKNAESTDETTIRLEQILADRQQLRQLENEKYAAYNSAIEKTIDLYNLKPKIEMPIGHSQMAAEHMVRWAPRYSENEKYVRNLETGHLMGRRYDVEENRENWRLQGVNITGPVVPPVIGAGTARDTAHIAIFYGAFTSRDNLASKIYHETIHWLDRNARGRAPNPAEHFESEIRAYQKQIDAQTVFSHGTQEVQELRRIQNIYVQQKNTPGSLSWGEVAEKHPHWLKGSNLSNFPQSEPGKPEPQKAGGELAFLDGLAKRDIQDAAADLRQRQDERHRELQKMARDEEAWTNRQVARARMMAEIAEIRAEGDRKDALAAPRRSQLYVMALAGEACANPARLSSLAEEGMVIRVALAPDAASFKSDDSLSGCQRDILAKFDDARRVGTHVMSHDFISWAHDYRVKHPSFVKKLANAFTGFFEIFDGFFALEAGETGTYDESSRGQSREESSDVGCIYTYIPEFNQTMRGCPVN